MANLNRPINKMMNYYLSIPPWPPSHYFEARRANILTLEGSQNAPATSERIGLAEHPQPVDRALEPPQSQTPDPAGVPSNCDAC